MRALRFIVAAVLGFLLFQYVVVYVGGFLAAVQIPVSYFKLFGRQHAEVGLALLNLGLHALPTIVLVAGGVLSLHRLFPNQKPTTWVPVFLGMLSCLFLWVLVLSPARMESMGIPSKGTLEELRSLVVFPWWAASNLAAPWLGIALAALLMSRSNGRQRRGVA
jgi:hypothetical protein